MSDKKEVPVTESESDAQKGIVIYSDAGARPNPGYAGWGAHGYLYTTEPSNKGTGLIKQLLTPYGYVPNVADAKQKHDVVQPIEYFDFFGTCGSHYSNNAAEIDALSHSLAKIKDYDVSRINVYTDSEYVRRGVTEWLANWKRCNWTRSDGTVVSNAHNWKALSNELDYIKDKNIKFSIQWVKGHSDNFGNIIADKLATIGVMHSTDKQSKNECTITPAQGYWKKAVDRHPFMNMRRSYFNSVKEHNVPGCYYLAEPGGDDFLIGKKVPESAYCVLRLTQPENIIETIKERQYEVAQNINAVMLMRLDKVYNPEVYDYIQTHGRYTLLQGSSNNFGLNFIDNKPVTVEINPPGLCLRAIDNFQYLDEILDRFLNPGTDTNAFMYTAHDITSNFYKEIEKKVKKEMVIRHELKSEFGVGSKSIKINVDIPKYNAKDTVTVIVPLVLGLDLPNRNGLKHIEDLHPKVSLMTWYESPSSIRYACIVQIDTGIGIWSNYCADRILIK